MGTQTIESTQADTATPTVDGAAAIMPSKPIGAMTRDVDPNGGGSDGGESISNVGDYQGGVSSGTANTDTGSGMGKAIGTGATIGGAVGSVVPVIGTAVGSIVGAGVGALSNVIFGTTAADKAAQQLKQQQALQQLQIQGSEQLDDYQEQEQLKLWNATSYPAQLSNIEAAGLNPALIYGGSGGGGATTGSGTPIISGGTASDTASLENADTNRSQQIENAMVQQTQAANNQQNTIKQTAETDNIQTDTQLIAAKTGNTEIATEGQKLENSYQTIVNGIAKATSQDQIDTVTQNLSNMAMEFKLIQEQTKLTNVDQTIKQASINTIIQTYNAQLANIMSQTLQNKAGAAMDQATANAVTIKLMQGWKELNLQNQGQGVSEENTKTMADAILKSAGVNAAGNTLNTIIKVIPMMQ